MPSYFEGEIIFQCISNRRVPLESVLNKKFNIDFFEIVTSLDVIIQIRNSKQIVFQS